MAAWKNSYAPRTTFNLSLQLRRILKEIDRANGTNLAALVPHLKHPAPRLTVATAEEFEKLKAHAAPWMRLWLQLTGVMALRFAEAEKLTPADYDRTKQTITVETKGGHHRTFPVPDEVAQTLAVLPEGLPGTLLSQMRGQRTNANMIRKAWKKLKKLAGVREELHPHDLRRTAAVRVYQLTKDIYAAKALLGHDQLTSTAIYLAPHEGQALKDLHNQLSAWTPPKGAPKQ